MNELIPLGKMRSTKTGNEISVSDKKKNTQDIVMGVHGIQQRPSGNVLHVKRRKIEIEGESFDADPHDLMTLIKHVTQLIGDYKKQDNILAKYMISSLRKCRAAIVSDLQKFGIHWEIDKSTGESIFWM